MNRVEILEQIRRFHRTVKSLPDGRIKVESEAPMTEAETLDWIEKQKTVQCPHCGTPYGRKKR